MSYKEILFSQDELASAAHSFLVTIYGEEILEKWRNLKTRLGFTAERDFMSWLLESADQWEMTMDNGDGGDDDGGDDIKYHNSDESAAPHTNFLDNVDAGNPTTSLCDNDDEVEIVADYDPTMMMAQKEMGSHLLNPPPPPPPPADRQLYHCHLCPFQSTASQSHVKRHIRSVHTKQKPFRCEHCNYSASRKENVVSHLIYKHQYRSKFTCEVCGKSFHSNSFLNNHKCYRYNALSINRLPT